MVPPTKLRKIQSTSSIPLGYVPASRGQKIQKLRKGICSRCSCNDYFLGHATNKSSSTGQIEIWKVKKLVKRLEAARGNGTSMISLVIRKPHYPSTTTLQWRQCARVLARQALTVVDSSQGSDLSYRQDVG